LLRDAKGSAGAWRKKLGHVIAESDQGAAGLGPDSLDRGRASSPRCRRQWLCGNLSGVRNGTKLRVPDHQYRSGGRRCEAGMALLKYHCRDGSQVVLGARLGGRKRLHRARRSFLAADLADRADDAASTAWFGGASADAHDPPASLLQARRSACSPHSGGFGSRLCEKSSFSEN
jgi:hypothetical protein